MSQSMDISFLLAAAVTAFCSNQRFGVAIRLIGNIFPTSENLSLSSTSCDRAGAFNDQQRLAGVFKSLQGAEDASSSFTRLLTQPFKPRLQLEKLRQEVHTFLSLLRLSSLFFPGNYF